MIYGEFKVFVYKVNTSLTQEIDTCQQNIILKRPISPHVGQIGLDFGGSLEYRCFKEQGVPIQAEKIPFEPDLGNASVGNGGHHILINLIRGHIPQQGVVPFLCSACPSRKEIDRRAVIMKKIVFIVSGGELGDPLFFRERRRRRRPRR